MRQCNDRRTKINEKMEQKERKIIEERSKKKEKNGHLETINGVAR